jgi:hypothetical protein
MWACRCLHACSLLLVVSVDREKKGNRKEEEEKRREEKREKRKEEGKKGQKKKGIFFQTWKFLKKIKNNLRSWSKIIFVEERYLPNYT